MKDAKAQLEEKQQRTLGRGLIFAIFIALAGLLLLIFGLTDKTVNILTYSEAGSSVDYEVHLLPNNSYADDFIYGSSDLSYPTSLIDYLNLNFNYIANFDQPVEGELSYKLVALTSANKVDNTTTARLWSEEKEIMPERSVKIFGNNLTINQVAKINYNQYVEKIRQFEADAQGVTAKGSLNVALIIDGKLDSKVFNESMPFESRIDFTIPIASNSSVEAKTSVKNGTDAKLTENPNRPNRAHIISIISGAVLLFVAVVIVLSWLLTRRRSSREHPYETKIKHLLNTYDGVIAEVSSMPNPNSKNVADVSEFDELLDVYNSVHLPINFFQDNDRSYFIITGEKNTWRYVIKKSDFETNGKKKASE